MRAPGMESKPISANGARSDVREEWIAQRNAMTDEKEKLRNEKLVDCRELGPNARELVAREVAMDEIRERARNFDQKAYLHQIKEAKVAKRSSSGIKTS